ncbi:hypothetical protein LTR17_026599 [Elasticomyces elasticus]|nr:hypothetical protein LTR17_026599 [Elasticomyces elasticus]
MGQRGTVSIYHPGYTDHGAVLFSLPATDGNAQAPGVHRDVLHTACALIANNRFDGFISASRNPHTAHDDLDRTQILPTGTYYFHLPQSLDAPTLMPYPIVPSFRTWRYPHDQHISGWDELRIQDDGIFGGAEAALARDQACRLTDSKEAVQAAHIIPKAEREWFALNSMPSYCRMDPTAGATVIDRSSNGILLRSDIHKLWDTYRLFFVPKSSGQGSETTLVARVTALSAELVKLYHNIPLQELKGISKECLLARFAYGVLRQLRTFLQSGRDRWLVVQENDGSVKMNQYTASECAQFAEDQGGGRSSRSPTNSASKSPKRRREDAESRAGNDPDADSEKLGDAPERKRQRRSMDSSDSAIAGITEWAQEYEGLDAESLTTDIDWVESELDQSGNWFRASKSKEQGEEESMSEGDDGEADFLRRGRQRLRRPLSEQNELRETQNG